MSSLQERYNGRVIERDLKKCNPKKITSPGLVQSKSYDFVFDI